MVNAVTNAYQPAVAEASVHQTKPSGAATPAQKAPQSQTPSGVSSPVDTVQISSAAQAATKEMLETAAQTAKEAAGGDHQAQRLLAKEAAAAKE